MTARRNATLSGIARAAEMHADLGLRERLKAGDRPVDVLRAIRACGITILFRPLEGLLGAYVPTPRGAGMLITTLRDHHVQRFTAAHELGHHLLGHRTASFDVNVGFAARGEKVGYDDQELEADAFASEFLLPKWLIVAHARRRGWTKHDLRHADTVYQLSLRVSASYTATCWALASADLISAAEASLLAKQRPKDSKQRAIEGITPTSWYPDVWLLSEHDRGAQLLGSPNDFLVFELEEHVAGGYEWDMDPMPAAGLSVYSDEKREIAFEAVGATIRRRVVAQGKELGLHRLQLEERRPWESHSQALNTFELDLALLGKEPIGLPRRERLLAA